MRTRRRVRNQSGVDSTQDARIAELERKNQDLEMCLASLLSHLARKGILNEEEWLDIAELTQDADDRESLVLLTDEDEDEEN